MPTALYKHTCNTLHTGFPQLHARPDAQTELRAYTVLVAPAPAVHLRPRTSRYAPRGTSAAMPAGGSSYLAAVATMGGRRSFAYHKLKKLPLTTAPPPTNTAAVFEAEADHHHQSAAAIEDSYRSYYRALGAAVARGQQHQRPRPRRQRRLRPRLRISGLARVLRRRAAAVGGRVRASVARVARRLREGRPYIADLFAGNYMFMQVAPSPTIMLDGGKDGSSFAPFTEYYYAKHRAAMRPPPASPVHRPVAAGVMYKV